jgi:hypothetical protein
MNISAFNTESLFFLLFLSTKKIKKSPYKFFPLTKYEKSLLGDLRLAKLVLINGDSSSSLGFISLPKLCGSRGDSIT